MSTIAVTGATGYIGSHIAAALKREGHSIYAMGRKPAPAADGFIPFALGGNNDYAPLAAVDTLIHCAYDFTCLGEDAIRRVNCDGSAELLREGEARGVKRIIYLSSLSAFEGAVSHYGRLKYETESAAQGAGALILRPGLVFSKDAGGIIGALGRLIRALPCVPVVGFGNQIFYPCHVEDLCALTSYLLANDIREAAPITAASEQTVTFRQIISLIAQTNNKRVLMIPVPYTLMVAALKTAEALHLNTGLRSDSLKYMKHINPKVDFGFLRAHRVAFRPFTLETLCS